MLDFDNIAGEITVTCDEPDCRTEEVYEGWVGECDLRGTLQAMRSAGWRVYKDSDNEWFHSCPEHHKTPNEILDGLGEK